MHPCVIRPRSSTAVASIMTSPAPEMAWVIVFWRCQSVGIPPTAEYWHIGETAIRFGAVRDPNATVVKSADIQNLRYIVDSLALLPSRRRALPDQTNRPRGVKSTRGENPC